MKAQAIDRYLADLTGVVRAYRPCAKIARNIYSEVVTNPEAATWFAQDLPSFLRNYDYTVVMAYSRMEKIGDKAKARRWFREMFDRVKTAHGTDKVIFKVQAYDWDKETWIDESAIKEEIEYLLSLGAKHVAYYPDGVIEDKPGERRDSAGHLRPGVRARHQAALAGRAAGQTRACRRDT